MEAARQKAERTSESPASAVAAIVFVLIWLVLGVLSGWWVYRLTA